MNKYNRGFSVSSIIAVIAGFFGASHTFTKTPTPVVNISNPNPVVYVTTTTNEIVPNIKDDSKAISFAQKVLNALESNDYIGLSNMVSPDGLNLNMYPYIYWSKNNIPKNEIANINHDTKTYIWGYTDGKGDPVDLSRADFIKSLLASPVSFRKAKQIVVNKKLGGGNTQFTLDKDAKGMTYVAFHFSGFNAKYEGMDWLTLYIVLDKIDGEYKLRAIAKDSWTI